MKEKPTNGLCLGFVSCAHFPLTLPSSAVGPGVFSSQKQRPESEFLHPRRSLKSHLKIQNSVSLGTSLFKVEGWVLRAPRSQHHCADVPRPTKWGLRNTL